MGNNYWKIPTWEEAEKAVVSNTGDALDMFIYDNEPAGEKASEQFRTELQELIDFLVGELE